LVARWFKKGILSYNVAKYFNKSGITNAAQRVCHGVQRRIKNPSTFCVPDCKSGTTGKSGITNAAQRGVKE
jgi:hypothetical protein